MPRIEYEPPSINPNDFVMGRSREAAPNPMERLRLRAVIDQVLGHQPAFPPEDHPNYLNPDKPAPSK